MHWPQWPDGVILNGDFSRKYQWTWGKFVTLPGVFAYTDAATLAINDGATTKAQGRKRRGKRVFLEGKGKKEGKKKGKLSERFFNENRTC